MKIKRKLRQVTCEICNNIYSIGGIATHFKDKHKMSVEQYVSKYDEYRPKYLDYNYRAAVNKVTCLCCNEIFGSERLLSYHIRMRHDMTKKDYILKYFLNNMIPLCKCGCGRMTSILKQPPYIRDYISGHNPNGMLGRTHDITVRAKMSEKAILRKGNTDKCDTKPELEFEQFLIRNNLEYLKQVPTEYGVVDFYLPDHNMYIEIDGDYWHPTSYEELNFQTLGNAINDNRKSNISNLYRIREGNVANIETIDDIFKFNHIYDFNIGYRQKIITKEYLSRKNYKKYIWLLLKFIRQFQPTFPFPATEETVSYVLKNIPDKIDNILVDDTFYNNRTSNIGVSYLKSNFKSYWNSKYKGNQTPVDIYNNDTAMKRIIRYRIGDNKSRETFDFSLHQIIRGISAIRGTISFFKPALAAAIYKHFLRDIKSPTVIDPCAGFGGRMLGFKSIYPEGKYIGIEPNPDTFKELQILAEGFDNIELHNCRLEDYSGSKECDLTFTSIPYYDTEIYSTHIEYKTIDEWKSTFIKQLLTFKNLTINVPANLRNCFDKNVVEYRLVNNTSHLNKCKNEKTEYILKIK